jgi:hypothetical protein
MGQDLNDLIGQMTPDEKIEYLRQIEDAALAISARRQTAQTPRTEEQLTSEIEDLTRKAQRAMQSTPTVRSAGLSVGFPSVDVAARQQRMREADQAVDELAAKQNELEALRKANQPAPVVDEAKQQHEAALIAELNGLQIAPTRNKARIDAIVKELKW